MKKNAPSYDWLIIGSGPGGSTAASVLTHSQKSRICLLEMGPDPLQEAVVPHSLDEMTKWYKKSGLNFALTPSPLLIGEASVLGGGSQINSGIYHPFPETIRSEWENEFRIKDFSSASLSSHQKWVEDILALKSHGPQTEFFEKMERAAISGYQWHTPPVWWKEGSRTFLRESLLASAQKEGLEIFTETKVMKISHRKNLWHIQCHGAGGEKEFTTTHLVLAGGPFENLRLLNRSWGSVYFHLQLRLLAHFPDAPEMPQDQIFPFQLQGPEASLGFSSRRINHLISLLADSPEHFSKVMSLKNKIFCLYGTPKLQTRIHQIRGMGKWIRFSSQDKHQSLQVLRDLDSWAKRSGARETLYVGKSSDWNRPAENFAALKKSTVHVMGGLGMGEADTCKTDSFGRMKDEKNLYLADSSLFNGSILANPQGSIMTIVRRNVHKWLE